MQSGALNMHSTCTQKHSGALRSTHVLLHQLCGMSSASQSIAISTHVCSINSLRNAFSV
jgi:hypothetical protein